jgi:hypothetical protein
MFSGNQAPVAAPNSIVIVTKGPAGKKESYPDIIPEELLRLIIFPAFLIA